RDHATELCREAAQEGYDVVVAFGGDGTVNEAANGLAGSDTPLSCLPGGRTNVYCRMLGIPIDVVDATEHLLRIADDWSPRRVDLGWMNERKFLFSAGVGLDASVVLKRAAPIDIPTIIWRALSRHARLVRHRRVYGFAHLDRLTVRSLDDRPLPLQVDGDYIGEADEARFGLTPGGIAVVS